MNSLRKLYSAIYKIMYIDLKFNETFLSFSIDSNHSQRLKVWQISLNQNNIITKCCHV